ncbi:MULTISPECIES: hydrogenase maturation nickel metallochaperone HypA [Protofrankia]|uniref:Hydrogenase maturation factor HypA n=1 Tax=Candidatus Protofrankia datiscae TaxID=2716812 RepID=F8B257_9ACTN|nr:MULTISPECIES: hydrogenase maturation nickel metallochaperone HypA [Protofrankia]AEH09851.1 hydrogenase expression/synthesis HypA [Candidatus Protofrankia datiscae]
MHELSICHAIAGIVVEHAGDRPVRTVNVRIGQLRQIVPDTLVHCWSLVIQGSTLDGSRLRVESVPARVRCVGCGHTWTLSAPVMLCGQCGGHEVSVLRGEEFLITSLELEEV